MANVKTTAPAAGVVSFDEEVVERRLNFKPDPELGNLCMGTINDVRIDIREVPLVDEKGAENTWEYAGCKFPTLIIEFKQCVTEANPKDRYCVLAVKPVTTLNKKGEPVDEKDIVSIMQQEYGRLRHIANQFKGLKNYPTDAGKCPSINYLAEPKDRCAQYLAFFEYFKHLLEGNNEKELMYKNVKLWIKVIADYKTRKYYTLPSFVNRGFVERVIPNQNPTLEFESNESVHLVKDDVKGARETAAAAQSSAPIPGNAPVEDAAIQSILDKYR